MTYLRKFKIMGVLLALGLAVASCVDNEAIYDSKEGPKVVEFYTTVPFTSTAGALYPIYSEAFDTGADRDLTVTVSYSGADKAPEDITLTVAFDTTAVWNWNTSLINAARATAIELGKDPDAIELASLGLYDQIDEGLASLATTTVTIPKGESKATFNVKLKIDNFDFTKKYAIGLTIKSTSLGNISGNFGTVIYNVGAKNKYDGVYTLKAFTNPTTRPGLFLGSWTWPYEVQLVSTGLKSVYLFNSEYSNDATHPIKTATGWSRFGSFTPEFTFDDNDKFVSVKNYVMNPPNGRAAIMNDTTNGYYDNEKKAFYGAFIMTQPGQGDYAIFDTLVYVRPR